MRDDLFHFHKFKYMRTICKILNRTIHHFHSLAGSTVGTFRTSEQGILGEYREDTVAGQGQHLTAVIVEVTDTGGLTVSRIDRIFAILIFILFHFI